MNSSWRTRRALPLSPAPARSKRRAASRWRTVARAASGAFARVRASAEAGMSTAEYAVGTVAAVSFAAVLIAVVRSDAVRSALTSIITGALRVG